MAASIQGIYLALFGRPADPAGLEYFNSVTGNGADLTAIGDLASTDEYQSRFVGMDNEDIINSIYQSLFGRDGEASGIDFYLGELAAGRLTINTIAIGILNGAQGTDLDTINAKIDAANLFTTHLDLQKEVDAYDGDAAAAIGREFIATVNAGDPGTPEEADIAILKLFPDEGQQPGGGGGPSGPVLSGENVDLYAASGRLVAGFASIQDAVDAAKQDGMKIVVHAGTYNEQITVDGKTGLTITGEGSTTVITMIDNPLFNEGDIGPRDRAAVVAVLNSSSVTVQNLVVDGLNKANQLAAAPNPDFVGIFFGDSSGAVAGTTVRNIADPLQSGHIANDIRGSGIVVNSSTGGHSDVRVTDNYVVGFQKGGIVASTDGTVAHIIGNTVVGAGLLTHAGAIPQNGIQVSAGAGGTVADNHISGIGRTATDQASSNILVSSANPSLDIHDNQIYGAGGTSYGVAIIGDADFRSNYITSATTAALYQDASTLSTGVSVFGTEDHDIVYGSSAADSITGYSGNDIYKGNGGNDILDLREAVSGHDLLVFAGTSVLNGVDQITGFKPDDIFNFGAFNAVDTLFTGDRNSNRTVTDNDVVVIRYGETIHDLDFGEANFGSLFPSAVDAKTAGSAQVILLVQGTDETQIYFVDSSLDGAATTITAPDVALVGVLTDVTQSATFVNFNFGGLPSA